MSKTIEIDYYDWVESTKTEAENIRLEKTLAETREKNEEYRKEILELINHYLALSRKYFVVSMVLLIVLIVILIQMLHTTGMIE